MFREGTVPKEKMTVNCLIVDGGIGDLLCALMPVNYILQNAPWINPLIWVPDYLVEFAKHVLPEKAVVRSFSEAAKKYDNTRPTISTKWISQHTPMRTHPVKYAFHMLADYSPKEEEMSYLKIDLSKIDLKRFNLPEKYVVMQGAAAERVKTMPADTFNAVKDKMLEIGYNVVVLGKSESKTGAKGISSKASSLTEYNLDGTINLMDKTSLLESAGILDGARCFIGMDGGLTHLAGFTDVPMVVGYTFANPEHLLPNREGRTGFDIYPVVPDEDLACRFCQTNWTLFYVKNHDFRNCYYGPEDYTCVKHMTADKFLNEIGWIINEAV